MLLQLLDCCSTQAEARIGIDFVRATTRHYCVTEGKVRAVLKHWRHRFDPALSQLNYRLAVCHFPVTSVLVNILGLPHLVSGETLPQGIGTKKLLSGLKRERSCRA